MIDRCMLVRLSHLMRHCSVGAVVRGPDHLLTVKDTSLWKGRKRYEIRHVERVRYALRLDMTNALCTPPKARLEDSGRVSGQSVPAMRFPRWTRCSKCGLLHHRPWQRVRTVETEAHGEVQVDPMRCSGPGAGERTGDDAPVCGGKLEQVPWVLAHELGYLADVPWHALAHREASHAGHRSCSADWINPYLKIRAAGEGYRVLCGNCRSSQSIRARFPYSVHEWQQPWFRDPPPSEPEEPAWILEINDVRVHSAETRTALVIPPESRIRKGTVVDRLYGSTDKQTEIREARNDLQRRTILRRISAEWRCSVDEIEGALQLIDRGYPLFGKSFDQDYPVESRGGEPFRSEYRALIGEIPDLEEDEDFVTEHHTQTWSELGHSLGGFSAQLSVAVDRLIAVNRLKEIMVLKGFRRLGGQVTPPDLTGKADWLPALELFGEGIFFTLRESVLQRWEENDGVIARAEAFRRRFRKSQLPLEPHLQVSPRFLVLHTLAHLMIRQLETRSGYPAASLKDRIYSKIDGDSGREAMAGVLIYVAVPDTEGSLGGLMSQAEPQPLSAPTQLRR